MPEHKLPSPSIVADMCAQQAWRVADDEETRRVLEYGAETIRELMGRCVQLARQNERDDAEQDHGTDDGLATICWQFPIFEGEVLAGGEAAVAENNRDEDPNGVGHFRTVTLPCATWFGSDRDAVELRALSSWLAQMADWLEGTR